MKVGNKAILCMLVTLLLMVPISACGVSRVQNASQLQMQIEIEIYGGFGITVVVKNIGEENLTNLDWEIELSGLIFFGVCSEGTIDPLTNETTIRLLPVGIGPGTITISVGDESASATFFIAGPFVVLT
ncbi:MAG: hypothetical protein U9O96_01475 [Candidatus Thermoplasmatota archaeon]|nr:hypothetical protein [Candidatus Thermoplasmatota archaeon]